MDPSKYDTAGTPQFHSMSPSSNASLPNSSILPTDALLARCWGPIRQEIHAWLQRNAPSLAELYQGAVLLLYAHPLPGRVRFISHAVREIRNRLPEAMSGVKRLQRLDYTSRLDKLAKQWRKSGQSFDLEETTPPPSSHISVDRVLYTEILNLIRAHEETRLRPEEAAQRLFEAVAPENLSAGFDQSPAEIPFNLRARVWTTLRPITDDPDPTPEYETRYGGSNMDPVTLSSNTTRGEAMHTVVRFALWVRQHLESVPDGSAHIQQGLAEMPEVREILEFHLNPEHDPALSIRAVYGRWFPWLVLLDSLWAASQVEQLFPTEPSEQERRNAAWEAYIVFCAPYDNVFDILREEYARAIEQIGSGSSDHRYPADPNQRLAEHLMTLYWRGKLSLEEANGLLHRFYANATDVLRGHTLRFVGRALHEASEEVPQDILARLKALWSYRLEVARTAPSPDDSASELTGFGWWFVSGKFDDSWSLEQLQAALALVKDAKPDHLVAERLAQIAARCPLEAVQCMAALIEGDREGWSMLVWEEHVRTILVTARESVNAEAREAAETLVHSLGAGGYLNFRDLLRNG